MLVTSDWSISLRVRTPFLAALRASLALQFQLLSDLGTIVQGGSASQVQTSILLLSKQVKPEGIRKALTMQGLYLNPFQVFTVPLFYALNGPPFPPQSLVSCVKES